MPQVMYSFFEEYDFSNKTIIPFTVHNGSRLSGTPAAIQELEPDPALYRHMLPEATAQFARLATEVWDINPDGKSQEELANAFIEALAAFIKEVGLPATFTEMVIPVDTDYKAIADTTVLTGGCCKKFTKEELLAVLNECK